MPADIPSTKETMQQACSILVIDDDEGIRESIRVICELEGYTVHTAENGRIALEFLKGIPDGPCLVLTDLMMPEMNGWKVVEAIHSNVNYKKLPVVVVTAFPFEAKTVQAEGLIVKPIDIELLLKIVRHWCGEPKKKAA